MKKRLRKKLNKKTTCSGPPKARQGLSIAEELGRFFIELASKQKTVPFAIFDDISERPWDFS